MKYSRYPLLLEAETTTRAILYRKEYFNKNPSENIGNRTRDLQRGPSFKPKWIFFTFTEHKQRHFEGSGFGVLQGNTFKGTERCAFLWYSAASCGNL
jgi:hypothetical protein